MKNPKTWSGATSWGHKGLNDKSGPSKEMKHNATRPDVVAPTKMDHWDAVPKSGSGYKKLGNGGHDGIGMPRTKASDRSEMPTSGMGMVGPVMKSKVMVPKEPKKWHKKGYTMSGDQ